MPIKSKNFESGLRIYNLFPRLAGSIVTWSEHLPRIRKMGFNCIFLNPFHLTGESGSLYAIKDYSKIDPHFILDGGDGWQDLTSFIHLAKKEELRIMIDLVINHTASDSDLTRLHPEWYKHGSDGDFQHPFCVDSGNGGKITIWQDLAEIENDGKANQNGLWEFWWELVEKYIDLGIDGFRCDAAYKVPSPLWEYLIKKARGKNKSLLFLAETLGCSEEETIHTARCGFDYIYNSSKWWDLSADWCLRQYEMARPFASSISFPETHDTPRLCYEMQGNIGLIKMRYLLAVLFSKGVMMPIGYEYGFMKALHVVKTTPQDWEHGTFDLVDFITRCNALKDRYEIFNEEGEQYISPLSNPLILVLKKISLDEREKVAIVVNKTGKDQQFHVGDLRKFFNTAGRIQDISVEEAVREVPDLLEITLSPHQVKVLYARQGQDKRPSER